MSAIGTLWTAQVAPAFSLREWPRVLAQQATEALLDEARLTPKPALVDARGAGAHHDLSLALLEVSVRTLRPHFERIAFAAQRAQAGPALRERLGMAGRAAERDMLAATGGVNTHRGAIWALGLLVAGAARLPAGTAAEVCRAAQFLACVADRNAPRKSTHGEVALRMFGASGARGEAAAGFPHVHRVGLRALRCARAAGVAENYARLDTLLAIMETLDDTCLLHRGGVEALECAQQGARRVRELGGSSANTGLDALLELDRSLVRLWASPGGSADLLAATLLLDRLQGLRGGCA
jgi:triphosphoribosyl-dephospho-CoA synthase